MTVVYTIPTIPDGPSSRAALGIEDHIRLREFGDVDYGPTYGIEDLVIFTREVTDEEAAELFGRYLAFNYEDNFRQVEVIGKVEPTDPRHGGMSTWILRTHIAWGDRPYYTPVA